MPPLPSDCARCAVLWQLVEEQRLIIRSQMAIIEQQHSFLNGFQDGYRYQAERYHYEQSNATAHDVDASTHETHDSTVAASARGEVTTRASTHDSPVAGSARREVTTRHMIGVTTRVLDAMAQRAQDEIDQGGFGTRLSELLARPLDSRNIAKVCDVLYGMLRDDTGASTDSVKKAAVLVRDLLLVKVFLEDDLHRPGDLFEDTLAIAFGHRLDSRMRAQLLGSLYKMIHLSANEEEFEASLQEVQWEEVVKDELFDAYQRLACMWPPSHKKKKRGRPRNRNVADA